jgi:hypothetical protein
MLNLFWGEPLRQRAPEVRSCLASGYPLHHLHALISFGRYGGSAAIPLANAPRWGAGIGGTRTKAALRRL